MTTIEARTRVAEYANRSNELAAAKDAPLQAIEEYPVRTVADLLTKVEFLTSIHGDDVSIDMVVTDLKRING